ncbi:hypothetical protein CHLNCDRAFT_136655 [Chlorella variabilis]|uniref:Uncharacterized protein n=1 Tax=Chlorella variabilis TaxID=554065 RepID=E1ZKS1_CHLVA|nr:hypothetical protein CHLNCDRAFT_136655 [Chlorella variabilis]EFN53430.1 hypothetical protein CHLNCDRAFT_136655 [Chlorella variabilis]|eukprot:XP_005845532.1 hypothetical protein CHLNCDRAFT_136655 [Chlorella variabilis]
MATAASLAFSTIATPPRQQPGTPARRPRPARALRLRSSATAAAEAATTTRAAAVPPPVAPALVAGSPPAGAAFPIPPERLVALAKQVHATDTGIADDSVLSDDFRFEFPIIKLSREEYLKTVRGFTFRQGIPNLSSNAYDFRVDPYESNRVWFTIRTSGTHTGPFSFGRATYPATGATIQGPPECCSYTFNEEGKVTSFTGGYVMDNRVGNTKGLGAAFGILAACGVRIPTPNSLEWEFAVRVNGLLQWADKTFGKQG